MSERTPYSDVVRERDELAKENRRLTNALADAQRELELERNDYDQRRIALDRSEQERRQALAGHAEARDDAVKLSNSLAQRTAERDEARRQAHEESEEAARVTRERDEIRAELTSLWKKASEERDEARAELTRRQAENVPQSWFDKVARERDEARECIRRDELAYKKVREERDRLILERDEARESLLELKEERDELREERNVAQAVADANLRTAQLSIPRPATDLADALYFLRAAQRVILDATQQNTP